MVHGVGNNRSSTGLHDELVQSLINYYDRRIVLYSTKTHLLDYDLYSAEKILSMQWYLFVK